jgi:N-methylhydantoinase B
MGSQALMSPSPGEVRRRLDPIVVELIRNVFLSTCEEMARSLVRSSHSPNIKERRDCSCCLYSPAGEMAVQAEHIPVHLGVMPYALRHILQEFPAAEMRPGDTFIVNDPYFGGNHLPDLIVAGPLFLDGKLVGFSASMAHHNDVGGMAPRSMPAGAVEIFQEGLRIPPVLLSRGGVFEPGILRLISINSRTPHERVADLTAQMAVVTLAQRRIEELGQRYSREQISLAIEEIIARSHDTMRAAIAALPDDSWVGESVADFAGELIPIRVTVRKDGTDLLVDFEGTAGQTRSPFNSCLSNTYACVFMAVRTTLAEGIPANAGMYGTLQIRAPEGSILNPRFPAAVSAATQVSYHTFEALMRALAPLAPDKVLADSGGGGVFSFGGRNTRTGSLFAYGEALGGGSGATAHLDGESAVMPPISNLHDTPVEALEMTLPLRIERYELVDGSGGAGTRRGGLGLRRAFRMHVPVHCSFQVSMAHKGPCGLAGGADGRPTRIIVDLPDGTSRRIATFTEYDAPAGTLITIETAGGGGYGPPEGRPAAAVEVDELEGYMPAEDTQERPSAA